MPQRKEPALYATNTANSTCENHVHTAIGCVMKGLPIQIAMLSCRGGAVRDFFRMRPVFAALAFGVLTACAAPPEQPEAQVGLEITGAADLNPDIDGRPSPAVVRVYVMSGTEAFGSAGYFELRDDAESILGDALLDRREILVGPGATVQQTFPLPDSARAVGVVVDFQDIEHAVWRASGPVGAAGLNTLHVTVGRDEVVLGPPVSE